jgi:hypothetical protein
MSLASLESAIREAGTAVHQPLFAKYEVLKDRLGTVDYGHWAAGFPEGNDHGFTHIVRVLEHLSEILGSDPFESLEPYELYLTAISVMYHDIGLLRQRKDHGGLSALVVGDERNEYLVDVRDREVIGAAVASHSSHRDIAAETERLPENLHIGSHRVRPKVIAALVRLADELDEDFRRADPTLEGRLNLPDSSRFFWDFSRRIHGIEADHRRLVINIDAEIQSEDLGRLVSVDGTKRAFVAAFAAKLAKLNRERVYVNRYLPESLRYEGIAVSIRPLPGVEKWRRPRVFHFDDETEATDLLAAFPELLEDPAAARLSGLLEDIRLDRLTHAARTLAQLEPMIPDLSKGLSTRILYDAACIASLRAAASESDGSRARYLRSAIRYLERWIALGLAGGFAEIGTTPRNAIFGLGQDADVHLVVSWRRKAVEDLLPSEFRSALASPSRASSSSGGGGCLVLGTGVRTPTGDIEVERLRPADFLVSPDRGRGVPIVSVLRDVRTSRQTVCVELDDGPRLSPAQPVLLADGSWLSAGDVVAGMRLAMADGTSRRVGSARRSVGHFAMYDLTVDHEPHTFVADGVICHNKSPARDDD